VTSFTGSSLLDPAVTGKYETVSSVWIAYPETVVE
jgi:hypothetical protein